jgi:hypothetical protein
MMARWWVIEESQFAVALERVAGGDDPGVVLLEFVANSDGETVTQGQVPTCGECGDAVIFACRTCDPAQRVIADRDEWIEDLAHESSAKTLAVPGPLRGLYLARVRRIHDRLYPRAEP